MLERGAAEPRVSTGLAPLDAVLGGLYWGDNVVWQFDATPIEPFYRAIAGQSGVFDVRSASRWVTPSTPTASPDWPCSTPPGSDGTASPGELLREIRSVCRPPGRRLMLFESLDGMMRAWGVSGTREFFTRCCPLLLEVGAIAYWSMSVRETPAELREAVIAVTQCVLRVDERSVQVVKAEGRADDAIGTVLHWHQTTGGRRSPRRRSSIASPPRCGRSAMRTSSASTTSATWPA